MSSRRARPPKKPGKPSATQRSQTADDAGQASSGGINLEVVNKIAAGTATAEEVQAHCMNLWRNGWIPTKWEHAKLGTEEMPVSGDVALRSTSGTKITEVSRDLKTIGYGGTAEYVIKDASGKEIVVKSPRLAIAGALAPRRSEVTPAIVAAVERRIADAGKAIAEGIAQIRAQGITDDAAIVLTDEFAAKTCEFILGGRDDGHDGIFMAAIPESSAVGVAKDMNLPGVLILFDIDGHCGMRRIVLPTLD